MATILQHEDDEGVVRECDISGLNLPTEIAWYLVDRGIGLPEPWQVPALMTPHPSGKGVVFDPDRVDKVLRVYAALRHTQGEYAGKPITLQAWQVAYIIAPIFGWVHKDEKGVWVRVIREAWVEMPRKNGKSTVAGGIGIYMTASDGEPGAQVVVAATSKEQAGYCFKPIAQLATSSALLKRNFKNYRSTQTVTHPKSGSYFKAVASVAEALHGANIACGIVDEVHLHKTPDLVEAIETGTGARRQPLMFYITTADEGKPGTVYSRKRQRIENLASGLIHDESVYGAVWSASISGRIPADPFSEESQRMANPGYGVTPTAGYLRDKASKAKDSPAEQASYFRLHLGIRTRQTTAFISLDDWDAITEPVGEIGRDERGRRPVGYGGLDLSSVNDITAFCLSFPERKTGKVRNLWRLWLPEARVQHMSRRTAGESDLWIRDGYLTITPGVVIDEDMVVDAILQDSKTYRIETIGFDRWHSDRIVSRLEEHGLTLVGVGQGYASLNAPMKQILRLVQQCLYIHGGNPAVRWMVSNLAVATDPSGSVKPAKNLAADKIDAVSAAATAMSEILNSDTSSSTDSIPSSGD